MPTLRYTPDALYVQEGAEYMKLALLCLLWLLVMGFSYRLPSLLDQGRQGLAEWKFLSDGLDNVVQFIFATSKGAFSVARRKSEIERVIADRVPSEALFQKPIFVGRQYNKEVANPLSHSNGELMLNQENSKPQRCVSRPTCKRVSVWGAGGGGHPSAGRSSASLLFILQS